MFRIIHSSNALPFSYPVDETAAFEGGMIAQLHLYGNNIVCGVSDGTAPLGILDDVKTTAFYAPAVDETHVVAVVGQIGPDGKIRSIADTTVLLDSPNIMPNSFVCDIPVYLRERNGAVVIPAGTELNYDDDGNGVADSVMFVCSYVYQIPGVPGDDSTLGSKRVTVWYGKMIFSTDKYEASQRYALNAPIFCNESGYLTTRQVTATHPALGMVVGPPSSRMPSLDVLWW